MRIHKLLASEDASKKKARGNTSKQKTERKKGERKGQIFSKIVLEVGRGKREANGK